MNPEHSLILIKIVHTAIWTVMAAAIVAIPIAALRTQFRIAGWLTALILVECTVLVLNRGHCPLTDMAARFTTERAANFDIYLPHRLAEHNKTIFGGLFIACELVWLGSWIKQRNEQKIGATPPAG